MEKRYEQESHEKGIRNGNLHRNNSFSPMTGKHWKNMTTCFVNKTVKKRALSYIAGENANWYHLSGGKFVNTQHNYIVFVFLFLTFLGASMVAQIVKRLSAVRETQVQSLGQEDPLREGNSNPLQYSCLENSMDRGVWRTTAHGVAKSQTGLSTHTQQKQE